MGVTIWCGWATKGEKAPMGGMVGCVCLITYEL